MNGGSASPGAGRGLEVANGASRGSYDLQNTGLAIAGSVCEGQNALESRSHGLEVLLWAARKGDSVGEPLNGVTGM